MAFEIVKTFVVKAPAAAVWDFLVDPQRVARCLPGASIAEKLDEKTYGGAMTVKVGPVSSSYKGKVVFARLDPSTRTAEIVATGTDVRGRGGADLRLTSSVKEIAPGETEVTAVSLVNITGILAQMGRGMIQDVSDQMFQIFSQRMRAELESAAPAAPPPAAAQSPVAATAAPSPAPAPAAVAPALVAPAAANEALDLGSLGARVARRAAARAVRGPAFWMAVVAIAVVLFLIFR
jgi:carbon monoxide dehydrogenase subunit G